MTRNSTGIIELHAKTGKCVSSIYKLAKKLDRIPTEDEVLAIRKGRPRKYE